MPIYQFVVMDGDHEYDHSMRWTHLPDEEAALRYGHLLIREFKSSGSYPEPAHPRLEVKDDMGEPLLSISFREIA